MKKYELKNIYGKNIVIDIYSGETVEAIEAAELVLIGLLDEVIDSNGSQKGIKTLIKDRLTHEMGNFV